jgi:hypothetical protein
MTRDRLVVIEDHVKELQDSFKDVESGFEWLHAEWVYVTNVVDAVDYVTSSHNRIIGIISDAWIGKTATSRRPDPRTSSPPPPVVSVLRRMEESGIADVPVFIYSRFFTSAGDGVTSDAINDALERYGFVVGAGSLSIPVERMIIDALGRFKQFHELRT